MEPASPKNEPAVLTVSRSIISWMEAGIASNWKRRSRLIIFSSHSARTHGFVRGLAHGNDDQNASVYDASGRRVRSFHAGDGIRDVQATEAGTIWISYFDEGIFGRTSLGQSGLVCLDDHGQVIFRYDALCGPKGVSPIDDCYAINVCSTRETWLYYYTDFPLVRLVDFEPSGVWRNIPVSGSHAFAVGHDRALFCGSYEDPNTLFVLDLRSVSAQTIIPLGRSGHPLVGFHGIGRRSHLYLCTSTSLNYLDINGIIEKPSNTEQPDRHE